MSYLILIRRTPIDLEKTILRKAVDQPDRLNLFRRKCTGIIRCCPCIHMDQLPGVLLPPLIFHLQPIHCFVRTVRDQLHTNQILSKPGAPNNHSKPHAVNTAQTDQKIQDIIDTLKKSPLSALLFADLPNLPQTKLLLFLLAAYSQASVHRFPKMLLAQFLLSMLLPPAVPALLPASPDRLLPVSAPHRPPHLSFCLNKTFRLEDLIRLIYSHRVDSCIGPVGKCSPAFSSPFSMPVTI